MKKLFTLITVSFILSVISSSAQPTFYNTSSIQKIELFFHQSNWDYQMDTAKYGSEGYLLADSVKINGMVMDSVGVKYKGNSSYDSTYLKNPMHINLDKYTSHHYQGFTDIKLANIYADPAVIREVLAYAILGNYMDCPKANFAELYINGVLIGLFTNDESIDKRFCGAHFYSSSNTFIKGNPDNPGPLTKSNLKYIDADSSSYFSRYDLQSKYGWNDLVGFCSDLTNNSATLSSIVDVDRAIWMLAYNAVFVNLDSYSGAFAQNHYWYQDNNGRYNPIVWDLNMCFGGFPFAGTNGTGMGSLTISAMQQMPLLLHANESDWPLIEAIINNPQYKRMYIAHVKTITEEFLINSAYSTLANQLQAIADTAVQHDPNSFYTYAQFLNGMSTNVSVGSYQVPGIANLMNTRATYIQADTNYNYLAPQISQVQASSSDSLYQSLISVRAKVSGAGTVYLAYRFDKTAVFQKMIMLDDGSQNDGAAQDSVFGAQLAIVGGSLQYYIYAENNLAGKFAPARAEHEFYTFQAKLVQANPKSIVINELLANNNSLQKDEYNEREDWIELYNNSTSIIDLGSLYLSDDLNQPLKWKLTNGTTLAPGAYTMVWADNDSIQQGLHTNFHLNRDSGVLVLSNQAGLIIDSVHYKQQQADISYGRYPNGTGAFQYMNNTFAAANTNFALAIPTINQGQLVLYPNPASASFTVASSSPTAVELRISNAMGQVIYREAISGTATINSSNWSSGVYYVTYGMTTKKLMVVQE